MPRTIYRAVCWKRVEESQASAQAPGRASSTGRSARRVARRQAPSAGLAEAAAPHTQARKTRQITTLQHRVSAASCLPTAKGAGAPPVAASQQARLHRRQLRPSANPAAAWACCLTCRRRAPHWRCCCRPGGRTREGWSWAAGGAGRGREDGGAGRGEQATAGPGSGGACQHASPGSAIPSSAPPPQLSIRCQQAVHMPVQAKPQNKLTAHHFAPGTELVGVAGTHAAVASLVAALGLRGGKRGRGGWAARYSGASTAPAAACGPCTHWHAARVACSAAGAADCQPARCSAAWAPCLDESKRGAAGQVLATVAALLAATLGLALGLACGGRAGRARSLCCRPCEGKPA